MSERRSVILLSLSVLAASVLMAMVFGVSGGQIMWGFMLPTVVMALLLYAVANKIDPSQATPLLIAHTIPLLCLAAGLALVHEVDGG